jgi:hypothetical protein
VASPTTTTLIPTMTGAAVTIAGLATIAYLRAVKPTGG